MHEASPPEPITLVQVNYLVNPLRAAIISLSSSMVDISSALMSHSTDEAIRLKGKEAFENMGSVLEALDAFQSRLDELNSEAGISDE